jgi:hypothetical protein
VYVVINVRSICQSHISFCLYMLEENLRNSKRKTFAEMIRHKRNSGQSGFRRN